MVFAFRRVASAFGERDFPLCGNASSDGSGSQHRSDLLYKPIRPRHSDVTRRNGQHIYRGRAHWRNQSPNGTRTHVLYAAWRIIRGILRGDYAARNPCCKRNTAAKVVEAFAAANAYWIARSRAL